MITIRLSAFVVSVAFLSGPALFAQSVQIDVLAGIFADAGGTPLVDGRLLQIVASKSDAIFTNPTATSFVGGSADDVVIASFSVNSGTTDGTAGTISTSLTISLNSFPGLSQGAPLMLRWFDIDFGATSPGSGTNYNYFSSSTSVDGGDPWFLPAAGSGITLAFLTSSYGGSQSDISGRTTLTAIPEPAETATFAALGALALGLYRRRLRSSK